MPKQILHLEIEPTGSISRRSNPPSTLSLAPKWQDLYEKGAQLVRVTVPTTDEELTDKVTKAINRCVFNQQRFALSPIPDSKDFMGEYDPGVYMLKVDRKGRIHDSKQEALEAGEYLASPYPTRMVIGRLFPGIKLALVQVPTRMTEVDKLKIKDALTKLTYDGIRWKMIGGTGGLKEGKIYFCDEAHEKLVAEHYQFWPETAISYLGVQVSECEKALIEVKNARFLIVEDHQMGTNDCRGWMSQSKAKELGIVLPVDAWVVYQFRIGLRKQKTQFKGLLKIMGDDVAAFLGADFVIPSSSIKPGRPDLVGKAFVDDIVFGIRDVSRSDIMYNGSYTVAIHASKEVIENELVPKCLANIDLLRTGIGSVDHGELLKMIGALQSDTGFYRVPVACLLTDREGWMTQHPYIHNMLKQALAQWAYRLLTGAGMKMPGRTLVDDGYLMMDNGQLFHGSDWLPEDFCITDQPGDKNLCVRFPVRMLEDLLPMKKLYRDQEEAATAKSEYSGDQAVEMLMKRGLSREAAAMVFDTQLNLHGTYILNANRAKDFGGDYDGDGVAVIGSSEYPEFVKYRFGVTERKQPKKDKKARVKSPWFNIVSLCFNAMGNKVGMITNAMSSASAAGREDLAFQCVPELQKEIDSLKHNTRADTNVIRKINEKVGKPAWLDIDKKLHSVDELFKALGEDGKVAIKPLSEHDRVALMFNLLVNKLKEVIGAPNMLSSYSSLFDGYYQGTISKGMLQECRTIRGFYGGKQEELRKWLDRVSDVVKRANQVVKDLKGSGDEVALDAAYQALQKAEADYESAKKTHRAATRKLRLDVCAWGAGKKPEEQRIWAAALNTVITGTRSERATGSILAHAFPQEFADIVAERSGGEPVLVDTWVGTWKFVWDKDRERLVQINNDGTRLDRYMLKDIQETENDEVRTVRRWRRCNPKDAICDASYDESDFEGDVSYTIHD